MATRVHVPLEEYLRTSYEYDREYVDGEAVERAMPTRGHSATQFKLIRALAASPNAARVYGLPDIRLRLAERKVRIPDLALYIDREPVDQVPTEPPDVIFEILSPDDRMASVTAKLKEYAAWGVPELWLADPIHRQFYQFREGKYYPEDRCRIEALDLTIGAEEVF